MFFSNKTKVVKAKLSSEDLSYFLGGSAKPTRNKFDYDNVNGTTTMDSSGDLIT